MGVLLLVLALLLTAAAGWVFGKVAKWFATLWALSRLPHPRMGLLGCMDMMTDFDHLPQIFTRFANELGGIYYVRVLHVPMVIVTDPALWQAALAPGVDLPKAPGVYGTMDQMTSPGGRYPNLVSHHTHSGYWRLVRKGIAPAFNPRNIRNVFPLVLDLTEQLSAVLYRAGPELYLDVDNLLQRESLDVIARIGFAAEFGSIRSFWQQQQQQEEEQTQKRVQVQPPAALSGQEKAAGASIPTACTGGAAGIDDNIFRVIQRAGAETVARLSNPLRFMLRHVTADGRRGERHLNELQARMRALLADIKARGPPAEDDTSIAAHLLRLRDPDTGQPLSDGRLAGEIALIFFGGFETSGHTLGWTLLLLAQHPEVQEKVCAELDQHDLLVTPSRPHPRQLEYSDLSRLKYLGMVVKESMRLVPVTGGTMRVSPDKPLQLGGYTIPAGVEILLAVHGLLNCEQYWDRPSEFLPERWADPQAEYWLGSKSSGSGKGGAHGSDAVSSGAAASFQLVEDEEALRARARCNHDG